MMYNVDFNADGELELLPEWAEKINVHKELVLGASLATKDGRRTGNAHIVTTEFAHYGEWVFGVLTDAGSAMRLTEKEIEQFFYVGKYISRVDDVLAKFDREGRFQKEPV